MYVEPPSAAQAECIYLSGRREGGGKRDKEEGRDEEKRVGEREGGREGK